MIDKELKCDYKDKCTSKGLRCYSCKKNTGNKDYYENDNDDFYKPDLCRPYKWPQDPPSLPLKITFNTAEPLPDSARITCWAQAMERGGNIK